MWELAYHDKFKSRFPRYKKNHPGEVVAMVDNLDTYHLALKRGAKPLTAHFGFLHREMGGVVAIDQSGGGMALKESRLYVYPDKQTETIWLITIGGKDEQARDLEDCRAFLKSHR